MAGAQPEIFQGRWGLVGLGHFYKRFVKNTRKKAPQGKIWEFFLLDTLKTTFWMENLTQRWMQLGHSLQNQGTFFSIFKIGQGRPPLLSPPSYAPRLDYFELGGWTAIIFWEWIKLFFGWLTWKEADYVCIMYRQIKFRFIYNFYRL